MTSTTPFKVIQGHPFRYQSKARATLPGEYLVRVSELLRIIGQICCRQRVSLFNALVQGKPVHSRLGNLATQTGNIAVSSSVKSKLFDILNRLGGNHECDRQTDRQTDVRTDRRTDSYSKCRA